MSAKALSVITDETNLVKSTALTRRPELAIPGETPYIYGYNAAALLLHELGAPYSTKESLKSICSKIGRGERVVPHFPVPVVRGQTVIFDRRRLTAWARWRNGGPEPSALYAVLDVAEERSNLEMKRIGATARRELKRLLRLLATTEDDAANRLTDAQMGVLVKRFRELLFDYGWDYTTNRRTEVW